MKRRRHTGGNPDENQEGLVKLARRMGATVTITSALNGWVDATVGFRGVNLLWEIKMPGWSAAVARGKKLTKTEQGQVELRRTWAGQIDVIETPEDVIKALLRADRMKPLDYQDVPDDWLASVIKAARLGGVLTT